ncbi:hypothetical protein BJF92_11405 [Rhizobium rhizosphaerae]|uniref:Uncharacterized protein n=1 Tax=Xaviernesmea rhizosphaerae TaxID=1672749 RepID=A0A1Q9AMX2_9HYPH|nr:hypothetical protein [Xaviernesmea rhizosphaerae]OLP56686.1 hypothetical protein BJF92_11405 [Xaviernesmea rhizosphaerae]
MAGWTSIFTFFGSAVGILTGLFVVWDRFYKHAPSLFLVAKPLIEGGKQRKAFLRLVNNSERPLIASWPNGSEDNVMRVATNDGIRGIVASIVRGETSVVLDGKDDRLFPVLKPPNWDDLSDDGTIEINVRWRFVQPLIWKRDRSTTVRIDKRSLKLLEDEADLE